MLVAQVTLAGQFATILLVQAVTLPMLEDFKLFGTDICFYECIGYMYQIGSSKVKVSLRGLLATTVLVQVVSCPWLAGFHNYFAQTFVPVRLC